MSSIHQTVPGLIPILFADTCIIALFYSVTCNKTHKHIYKKVLLQRGEQLERFSGCLAIGNTRVASSRRLWSCQRTTLSLVQAGEACLIRAKHRKHRKWAIKIYSHDNTKIYSPRYSRIDLIAPRYIHFSIRRTDASEFPQRIMRRELLIEVRTRPKNLAKLVHSSSVWVFLEKLQPSQRFLWYLIERRQADRRLKRH